MTIGKSQFISDGKLFQSRGAATVNILSQKNFVCVRRLTSVWVSAEHKIHLTPASVTSSAR